MTRRSLAGLLVLLCGCAGAQLERQKKQIEELQTQAGTFVSQLKEKADEVEALKSAKAELEAKDAELEGKLASAETRIASLERSNKDLSAAVGATGASKDELGAKLNAAVAEKDALARQLADGQKERLALVRLKTVLQSARDKAGRDLAKAREERDKLASDVQKTELSRREAEEARLAGVSRAREDMGAVADALLPELQSGAARLDQDGGTFALTLSEALLFEENSAKLTPKGEAALAKAATALKALGGRELRVEGHTDNAPFKKSLLGGYAGHWELSAARAVAVSRWLRDNGGLDGARLSALGYGELRPAQPNDTAAGRAANRRVVISVGPLSSAARP